MVFKRRTIKNTRKFKPSSKTSIKTSTINKRSVGNNRTVKVSQTSKYESKQDKTHRPIFPQPSSKKHNTGGGSFNPLPPASAATVNTPDTSNIYPWQQSNTIPLTLNQIATAQDDMDTRGQEYDDAKKNLPISSKYNTEKNYTTHQVNFKNLYGENKITPVLVKTRGSHLNNDGTVRMLAAMELQKQGKFEDYSKKSAEMSGGSYVHGSQLGSNEYGEKIISNAQKNHGNVFNHVYNTSTGNYVGFKDPTVSKSKNLTDSNNNPRLVKTKAPRLYGDRELPGIGRMSYTGFAGGKKKNGDHFKFTKPEGVKKVWNTFGTPQWMKAKKLKPDVIEKRLNKQFENRSMSSFTEGGRHKTSGGQNVFGSLDQYQEQESIDWSKGGKDYTNPGWTRQEEQMKIRQAENKAAKKEEERINKLNKGKTSKGSIDSVILSWNKGNSLVTY